MPIINISNGTADTIIIRVRQHGLHTIIQVCTMFNGARTVNFKVIDFLHKKSQIDVNSYYATY